MQTTVSVENLSRSEFAGFQEKLNIKNLSRSEFAEFQEAEIIEVKGTWPENLSGHVFIVAPFHRDSDRHLFAGEGVIIRWDLKAEKDKVKVHSKKLKTWDSFWRKVLPIYNLSQAFFPAVINPLGISEIANTAIVNMNGRLILTADAGRYWEVDPKTLNTITPIGYFDEHIISVPVSFFPMVANTAHPLYAPKFDNSQEKELITCELKSKPRPGKLFTDMVSAVYITRWDGKGKLKHWELEGTILDGSPHTTIVTEKCIAIPDMPFQMGVSMLLGLKIPPQKAYPKTQVYIVNRQDLKEEKGKVSSRLVTFPGDSYHFLCNYHHINEDEIHMVAIQQATISLTEAIKPGDVRHFTGEPYTKKEKEYFGIPWMFAFDPGVLRKVVIKDAQLMSEQAFIHPGWFTTTLYTADPREFSKREGYSAIYQVYAGYHRDLICRRQYLSFRDQENRMLTDEQLPQHDLPSVLAKVPLERNWQDLTKEIEAEKAQNPHIPVYNLGKGLLDFYVYPPGHILDSIQFIPQDQGYVLTTVLTPKCLEAWLFAADNISDGPVAKLRLPENVHFGFTLHSEYFEAVTSHSHPYKVNRLLSDLGSLTKVPYEFFFNRQNDLLNRKVSE